MGRAHGLEIRTLCREDLSAGFALDQQAFNTPAEHEKAWNLWVDPARGVGAFDDGRLVAMVLMLPLPQVWGGRPVSMEGISSVAVAPEWRGQGIASALMRASLVAMRGRSIGLSALFPGTTALYRGLGWEMAGLFQLRRVAPRDWHGFAKPKRGWVRRGTPEDLPAIRACYSRVASSRNGFLTRDHPDDKTRWFVLDHHFERHEVLVFAASHAEGGSDELDGYLVYKREPAPPDGFDHRLRVLDWVAMTREATEGLAWTLGTSGSQVELITYPCAATDPLWLLEPEQRSWVHGDIRWMLRVVDVRSAITERGFPSVLRGSLHLDLQDAELAENAGSFTLHIADGRATLTEGSGAGAIEMDIGAFSSLYSGWADCETLARMGRLHGGDTSARALLDAAFAGPSASLLEEF